MKKFIPLLVVLIITACGESPKSRCIIADDSVVSAYLAGDIDAVRESWAVQSMPPFSLPPEDDATKSAVDSTRNLVMAFAKDFLPANAFAMDKLFKGWRRKGIRVSLIVGCPQQYATFTAVSPDGTNTFVINILSLANYGIGDEVLSDNLRDIFNHEFIHILMKERGLGAARGEDYLSTLDSIAYNEGFAHLLSHESRNIRKVDWKAERTEHFDPCRNQLAEAMEEEDPEIQSLNILKSDTGYYYDRFAAASSMLYLSRIYDRKGVRGLKRELSRGPKNICRRISRSKK